ncbi:hypothetical protein [Peptoniphilus sp. BV3AC2]|uniref:hypothetical protein n=1 Tax=Peptoniphilus sp. BV3AC2 TaxID=1111133 RepID=UPI0003B8320B|nr:hypothetical protein [Peptoniphilus sp. BV3AC2]ERT64925.1 hypothetical protein HMPREF1252_1361 [Peptoniphilus sp. BV3AC2]
MLTTHRNDFHNKNIYIDFENGDISPMLSFRAIADKFGAPLQIMLEDKDDLKRNFILQNGFKLVRTCYSCEFYSSDLKIVPSDTKIMTTVKNREFSWNYYNHYKKMHQAINPLTASFEEFVEILPNEVYFVDEKNFAFVEDNEIAYVLCEETSAGDDFLLALCHALFCKYETIVFEADDVDPIAMRLKNKFVNGFVEKTETWIYK